MAEAASIPEFDIAPIWGVLGPAGTPQPIVDRLESWFADIKRMEATSAFLASSKATSYRGGAKDLAALIPTEIKKVGILGQDRKDRAAVTHRPKADRLV